MSKKYFIIMGWLFLFFVDMQGLNLKKLLSIGSNDINYIFFTISGAVLDEAGNIYVSDGKGSFIRKYDQQGKFIKEIGKRGQGPGDFSDAISGMCWNKELYVLDGRNYRIAVLDKDLNINKYIKINYIALSLLKINNLFYSFSSGFDQNSHQIVACDDGGKIQNNFFNERPDYINKNPRSKMESALMMMHSGIQFNYNKETHELVAVFQDPGKKIEIFYFSPEGKLLRKQEIAHLINNYSFPKYLLEWPLKYPDRSTKIGIDSVFYLEGNKILLNYFIGKYKNNKNEETHAYLLIIDALKGKILQKEEIDSNIKIMDVKGNVICSKRFGEEMQQIILYEMIF